MFFEVDSTVFYILLLLAVQVVLAGLIVFLWLFRRTASGGRSERLPGASLGRGLRLVRIFAVVGAALSLVGVLTYLFFRPSESLVTTYYQPPEVTSSAAPDWEDDRHVRDEQAAEPAFDESWRGEKGAGDSRIREIVRKTLQGDAPSPSMAVNPVRNPSLNTYLGLINTWLGDAPKSRQAEPQLVDSLYDRLVTDYGFQGPKSLLAEYIASTQSTDKESSSKNLAFLQPGCGKEAQVRWWRKTMTIAGAETPVFFFSMESVWSHGVFVRAFTQETLQTFFQAHLAAFRYFGGIFQQISYIELPRSLLAVVQTKGSESNEEFRAFAARYNFEVELSAEPSKRENHLDERLSHLDSLESMAKLNEKLREICQATGSRDGERSEQLFEAERLCLLNLSQDSLKPAAAPQ